MTSRDVPIENTNSELGTTCDVVQYIGVGFGDAKRSTHTFENLSSYSEIVRDDSSGRK